MSNRSSSITNKKHNDDRKSGDKIETETRIGDKLKSDFSYLATGLAKPLVEKLLKLKKLGQVILTSSLLKRRYLV